MKIASYTFDSLIIICCFWLNTRPLPYSRGLFPGKRMVRMCLHLIWSGCTSSVSCGVWELCWSLTIARRWRNSPEQTLNLTYLLLPKDHRTPFLSFLWAKEVTDSYQIRILYIKKKLERFFSTILLKHLFSNRDKRANRTKQTNKQTNKKTRNKQNQNDDLRLSRYYRRSEYVVVVRYCLSLKWVNVSLSTMGFISIECHIKCKTLAVELRFYQLVIPTRSKLF